MGIWKPAEDDSGRRWIRDDTALHADWWALEPALARKPKDSPTRICVLGESVAAGWLHAPHITPSAILRRQLDAVRPGAYEVIDLSAVNLQPSELRNLAAASLQLDPDILLIFAGSHWPIGLPPYPGASVARFQAASEALRRGGPAGLMELSDSWTLALSRHVVDVIGELARRRRGHLGRARGQPRGLAASPPRDVARGRRRAALVRAAGSNQSIHWQPAASTMPPRRRTR